MQSVNYDDVSFSIRPDFSASHTRFWQRLQSAGCWLDSRQKIDIARAVREARHCDFCCQRKQALSPKSVSGKHKNSTGLSDPMLEAVHTIVTDASRITESWYQDLLTHGLTDGEYVELVGTVVSLVSIDSFADAVGASHRPLPSPGAGKVSQYRPATAETSDQAWVPMLDSVNAGTPEADLWPSANTGNVVRALSLVPDEVRMLKDLSAAHYLEMKYVRQAGVDAGRALDRSQMELVAGRVSALNRCYY